MTSHTEGEGGLSYCVIREPDIGHKYFREGSNGVKNVKNCVYELLENH